MIAPRSQILAATLTIATVAACYPKAGALPGAVDPTDIAIANRIWPTTTPEMLAGGRTTYAAKCNGCHDYPELASIDESKWADIVARMGKKAGLDAAASESVLRFVVVARARAVGH